MPTMRETMSRMLSSRMAVVAQPQWSREEISSYRKGRLVGMLVFVH